MSRLRAAAKNAAALAFGCVVALVVLEIALQVKNPIESRVRADRIVLPAHRRYALVGGPALGPSDTVIHTKNSLGFRGPEPPAAGLGGALSVVAIGGSTTECYYLPDGTTWPERLADLLASAVPGLWINNAGLDGHSTFGHSILVRDYVGRLKPRVALFLVGLNEVEAHPGTDHVREQIRGGLRFASIEGFVKSAAAWSEVASVALNLYRYARAKSLGLPHRRYDWRQEAPLPYPEPGLPALIDLHRRVGVPGYEARLTEMIRLTRGFGIVPVLVTQPALVGSGKDDVTGVDLAAIPVNSQPGDTPAKLVALYNEATQRVAAAEKAFVVDLAAAMPRSSRFFYDPYHFTIAGADTVARIISGPLTKYLKTLPPS